MNITRLDCCGIKEIANITGEKPERITKFVAGNRFSGEYNCAYYVFTEARDMDEGYQLAMFIKENNLGEVIHTGRKINPNSGNPVRVWVWTVSNSNLKSWWHKQGGVVPIDCRECLEIMAQEDN